MNVSLDREKFKELLVQFSGDIKYQTELIECLLTQLPAAYRVAYIESAFFEYCYKEDYYILQHSLYQSDVRYFLKIKDVADFLDAAKLDSTKISISVVCKHLESQKPLCGYVIRKVTKENL